MFVSQQPLYLASQAHYPPVYYNATLAETLLVTRFRTIMSLRHMPLMHQKFRGHTISFMQNLKEFVAHVSVPLSLDTLAFFIVRMSNASDNTHQDYRVRKAVVIELLKWLPMLLPEAYSDVEWPTRQIIPYHTADRVVYVAIGSFQAV